MARNPAVFAAALLVATLPQVAHAQGTQSQRDACTPDALRLCQGTIPDVARTTACLVAHRPQLSVTCRDVFAFAEPVVDRTPRPASTQRRFTPVAREHVSREHVAREHVARESRHVRAARRAPYHIPHFSQAEAEAEVHVQYEYRTPYLPYWANP